MKTRLFLTITFVIPAVMASGQRPAFELAFTAENNGTYVQLDSIKIMNRTLGGDTVLVYPDTVLVIEYVGIPENLNTSEGFSVQAYPNPVADYTKLSLFIPENDVVRIHVTDLMGRLIIRHEQELLKGIHTFTFTPGGENFYLVTAEWKGYFKTVKIVNLTKSAGKISSLSYEGFDEIKGQVKAMVAVQSFDYTPGDELLYIGYTADLESGIIDAPNESRTYTFQFATNIPCPGVPTVEYEGQVYNTIQIFSQCWLKENLNVGGMINGTIEQSNNGTIEKYCHNNQPDSCEKYGALYQWDEMMQYTTKPGVQGICPPGWHIPSDEEIKILEGAVDRDYGFGNPEWDDYDFSEYRGFDGGTNLKSTTGWYNGGDGTDLFGFSSLPNGYRMEDGTFGSSCKWSDLWTSSQNSTVTAWDHYVSYWQPGIMRWYYDKVWGLSVRCLMDD